jgi:hypothetical protein
MHNHPLQSFELAWSQGFIQVLLYDIDCPVTEVSFHYGAQQSRFLPSLIYRWKQVQFPIVF